MLKALSAELQKLKPNTGSPIKISAMLLDAHAAGKFSTDASGSNAYDTFLSVLSDAAYNLDKKPKGRRYCDPTKNFYAALTIRYGPAAAEFVGHLLAHVGLLHRPTEEVLRWDVPHHAVQADPRVHLGLGRA